jgi:hypothetical protein
MKINKEHAVIAGPIVVHAGTKDRKTKQNLGLSRN